GAERWTRQVLFLKGRTAAAPNYFVFRDSFHQTGTAGPAVPKWWYLRTPGPEGLVAATATEIRYTSPHGPRRSRSSFRPQSPLRKSGWPPARTRAGRPGCARAPSFGRPGRRT